MLTISSHRRKSADGRAARAFRGTRAKYVALAPKEHDQITGMLSHLPHIIASGLVNQADAFNQAHPRAQQLAAGGFAISLASLLQILACGPISY